MKCQSGKCCGTRTCSCNCKSACSKCRCDCASASCCAKCTSGSCGCAGATCCNTNCRCSGCKVNCACFEAKNATCPDGICQIGRACGCGCKCSDACQCSNCKAGCKCGGTNFVCSVECISGQCCGTADCQCDGKCACPKCRCNCASGKYLNYFFVNRQKQVMQEYIFKKDRKFYIRHFIYNRITVSKPWKCPLLLCQILKL
ncbi:Tenascin-X [Mizuhopecten yessoensis]|uniref:Tenascin-X n=1 Tax=Mizuhopecten yessoensis TaxID=6573 RepID=A0A210PR67_MIZYE|nr:Tenascin-X [Mizuhopecten yessoensis]